jgi:hypothetical protein
MRNRTLDIIRFRPALRVDKVLQAVFKRRVRPTNALTLLGHPVSVINTGLPFPAA